MQRIGIYGGSFDPVHQGHLDTARGVAKNLSLDSLHFVPCGQHAFDKKPTVHSAHRLAMLELAVTELSIAKASPDTKPQWQINTSELEREGVSYTVDTCRELRETYGEQAMLCLVMGTDAMNDFHRWRNWRDIISLVNVVLVDRAVVLDTSERQRYQTLTPDADIQRWLDGASAALTKPAGQVMRLALPPQPFSSTQIRRLLSAKPDNKQNCILDAALPATVRSYIEKHQLYAGCNPEDT